jgi:hypothetical protein
MKRRVLKVLAVAILSVGVAFFCPSARAGNLPSGAVKVIPRVSNPVPPSSRPVSNNPPYQGRSHDTARVRNDASASRNGTHEQSRPETRQRTDGASAANERRDDAVCTSGNPKLMGVHCSASSECSWGARCVGQPARCANTGAPCVSSTQCMVPGVCSADLGSVSNRGGGTPARTVPVSHTAGSSRIPTAASGGRGVDHGVSSR